MRRGGRAVVDGVCAKVGPGERIAIIGPNGSGKTTLLRALLGLIPVDGGAVLRDGRRLDAYSAGARAQFAAYVPQSLPTIPAMEVVDVVAGGRFAHRASWTAYSREDRLAIEAAIERCGLAPFAGRTLDTLSGGERQKVLLAAALAQDPTLLVLDEPTTALDPAVQLEVARLLDDWQSGGRTLVVVSHDLQLPAVLGGRVLALQAGRLVADGSVGAVLTAERLEEIYAAPFRVVEIDGRRIVVADWWGRGNV